MFFVCSLADTKRAKRRNEAREAETAADTETDRGHQVMKTWTKNRERRREKKMGDATEREARGENGRKQIKSKFNI